MDHPRIRGEHQRRQRRREAGAGSSPHTRGARAERRRRPDPAGIIPAYAGSTRRRRSGSRTGGDHPRIRGEHILWIGVCRTTRGSSPHTRGAPDRGPHESIRYGIIPAYAGSTPAGARLGPTPGDHPRIRGEHKYSAQKDLPNYGSSPHTRGAPGLQHPARRPRGIIPAYAGSTRIRNIPNGITLGSSPHMRGALAALCRRRVTRADHPRIRGEHGASQDAQYGGEGSSPHTRGALNEIGVGDARGRIIPAYAGSTAKRGALSCRCRDHPRIRGEHTYANMEQESILGSSPHTRGAHAAVRIVSFGADIIPAYAGSTPATVHGRRRRRDHPRIRGEHERGVCAAVGPVGSSPHTRGARRRRRRHHRAEGIIPAYAGSTMTPWI